MFWSLLVCACILYTYVYIHIIYVCMCMYQILYLYIFSYMCMYVLVCRWKRKCSLSIECAYLYVWWMYPLVCAYIQTVFDCIIHTLWYIPSPISVWHAPLQYRLPACTTTSAQSLGAGWWWAWYRFSTGKRPRGLADRREGLMGLRAGASTWHTSAWNSFWRDGMLWQRGTRSFSGRMVCGEGRVSCLPWS